MDGYVRLGLEEFVDGYVRPQLVGVLSRLMGFFLAPVQVRLRNVQTCLIFELDA